MKITVNWNGEDVTVGDMGLFAAAHNLTIVRYAKNGLPVLRELAGPAGGGDKWRYHPHTVPPKDTAPPPKADPPVRFGQPMEDQEPRKNRHRFVFPGGGYVRTRN
jgi:hypothetical protein